MDGKLLELEVNENNHDRGLHIVMIDVDTGKVSHAEIFDTYKSSNALDWMIKKIDGKKDFIIVAACKDECVTKLSFYAKKWFSNMGSAEIWNLQYREAFAFIGSTAGKKANEKRASNLSDTISVS